MSHPTMSHADLVEAGEMLVPLVREKAREAELARRPLDEVIDAVRASGLYSMMGPREYGGHEADLDTFFEVTLTLSRADAGLACQSSADCCPGLACAGGVAGYGTVGRCEVPR